MTSTPARPATQPGPGGARDVDGALVRTRVLEVLDGLRDVRVVSVEAPGGFGKTTALRQWTARDGRAVVWITVHPQAPDATWLALELVAGLNEAGVLADPVTLPAAPDSVAWHVGLLPALERAIAQAQGPFLIVVDEAGALSGPQWSSLAASIARALPDGCQLVLAARSHAPASLRRLRSSGQFVVVGPDVLALDAVEGDQLLQSLGLRLDHDAVLELLERTGGWPIALPLVASALQSGRWAQRDSRLVTTEALADYLRHEVLQPLAAVDAHLLLRSAVLPVLDGPTCDAVSGSTGSLGRLRRLAASTHLLASQDVNGDTYRMHPLLAAFLEEELRASYPIGWHEAHAAAARVAERGGDLDAAFFHLRVADDDDRLGQVVWAQAGPLLGSGRTADLRRWLEGIDDDRLCRVPGLALAAAWVASQEGDMIRMERMRLAAHAAAVASDPRFLLEVGLLDATVGADGVIAIGSRCQRFLEERGESAGSAWHTLALFLSGVVSILLARPDEARDSFERGERLAVALDLPLMTAHCVTGLADIALMAGDRASALERVRQARTIVDRHRLDHIATAAPILATSAQALLLEGRMDQARQEATRALRLISLMGRVAPWHAVQGRLALASVYLGLGDGVRARQLLREAEEASGAATRSPVLDQMLQQVRERAAALAGPADEFGTTLTTAEVRVLQYLPTHMSFPEIAAELYVSRHTVKTQALSAYRKLGAHTRGEAIEKARARGLLPPR